jgi:hypothetical protein
MMSSAAIASPILMNMAGKVPDAVHQGYYAALDI